MLRLSTLALASLVVLLSAFSFRLSGTPTLPEVPIDYEGITFPTYLNTAPVLQTDNTPANNRITNAGVALGRVLFYDTRLSLNETVSCASCHRQENGFSDPERLSAGFEGEPTARNSMGLAFSRFYENGRFFWDERAQTLEHQVLQPIQDTVEMGMTLDGVTQRLVATDFYPDLFTDAFGSPDITSDRVSLALSQFVRSIVATNSRYDVVRQQQGGRPGRPAAGFTAQENLGLDIFFGQGQCNRCHAGEFFVGDQPRNNGLDATITDAGAGGGRFKMSSLRNVALTAPYMHDGRFATLEEVVEHYNSGVQNNPNLDPRLRNGGGPGGGQPRRLNLSASEKAALVAFMRTMTDETLATDERWSNPFLGTPTASEPTPASTAALSLAGPNPVRTETAFRIHLDGAADVRLDVYSATGRRVATLLDGRQNGTTMVRWSTTGLAAGVYVARLRSGGRTTTQTVTVVR